MRSVWIPPHFICLQYDRRKEPCVKHTLRRFAYLTQNHFLQSHLQQIKYGGIQMLNQKKKEVEFELWCHSIHCELSDRDVVISQGPGEESPHVRISVYQIELLREWLGRIKSEYNGSLKKPNEKK